MRRPALVLFGFIVLVGALAAGVAMVVQTPTPPAGAPLGQRVYYRYCVDCHGVDGRGSWRATFLLVRPGDLTDPARQRAASDEYLFQLIKNGGAPLGKPGMPGFGFHLDEEQIAAVITYVRTLAKTAANSRPPIPTAGRAGITSRDNRGTFKEPAPAV
jgi:mono/diheme cytochrome c family protein